MLAFAQGGMMVPEKIKRIFYGQGQDDVMEMPNLIDIQLASYERCLLYTSPSPRDS